MSYAKRSISIEDLVGSKIVTAGGRKIGHVVDLEVEPRPDFRVTSLRYGPGGWLSRLHVFAPLTSALGIRIRHDTIPWTAVDHIENFTVILKPEWDEKRLSQT
jgi:sporulation protein YlmC with PRC-barrel domain